MTPLVDSRGRMTSHGLLKVLVRNGTGLRGADFNGKSDPYVILQSGGKELKSRVVKSSTSPQWNEELSFPGMLQEFTRTGLGLQVFDYDAPIKMSADDALGSLSVSLDFLKHEDKIGRAHV